MLSGQANDYFGDTHHLRGGSPTPNESSLRTGLTPGGSGSITVLLCDHKDNSHHHRLSNSNHLQPSATSQPQETPNGATTANPEANPSPGSFDPHDNNTANGPSMLAQGRNGAQSTSQFAVTSGAPGHAHPAPVAPQNMNTSPHVSRVNGGSIGSARGMSEVSIASDESEQARPNTRGKGKRNPSPTNARRKADESPAKAPTNKKSKTNTAATNDDMDFSDEWSKMKLEEGGSMSKMTDEEKRKNFLERNRVAAYKCRQKKKRLLTNLQTKVELFNTENDALTAQITHLREEMVNLKTLLFAHKDCPITHQQELHGASMSQVIKPFNLQMNPYGMAAPMPNQVVAYQDVQRRFS
ncbi:hypothetical protein H9L39_17573 [Fusarium oxysporum f. sp. albedinis]|nr:hypothetical protein H9L39_17573 [Fusarium oxysporum f. sp. albedinis]